MLRKVDPANPVLVSYLMTINPDIEIGVLLKTREGPSKKKRGSKKETQSSSSNVSPVAKEAKSPKKVVV